METIEERAEKYYQSLARPLADEKGLVITAYCVGAETERLLKHGISGKRPDCPKCGMPSHPVFGYMCASEECVGKAASPSGAVDKTVRDGPLTDADIFKCEICGKQDCESDHK